MCVHVCPENEEGDHDFSGTECWCGPRVQYVDDDGSAYANGPIVVHKARILDNVDSWGVYRVDA